MKNRNILWKTLTTNTSWTAPSFYSETISLATSGSEVFTVTSDTTTGNHDALHSHGFIKTRGSDYVGSYQATQPRSFNRINGLVFYFMNRDSNSTDFNQVTADALSDLYDKLRSDEAGSGLNLAVDIAEAKQVKTMLQDAWKAFAYIKYISPKRWAKSWLEYQYGWKPLVQSVYGSFDAILHRRLNQYTRVTGKGRSFEISWKKFSDVQYPGATEVIAKHRRRRAMYVCEYALKNSVQQQLLGYTSLNPATIIWELVPYSFVVDWFVNVGGYLQNLESALAFAQDFKRGYLVCGEKCEQYGQVYGGKTVGTTIYTSQAKAYNVYTSKVRTVLQATPLPRAPVFHVNLGWQRLLSGASLLAGHVGRK